MTEFDPKWPHGHTTRGGKEARIYALDGTGSYPIHGAIKVGEKWEGRQWQINGSWLEDGRAAAADTPIARIKITLIGGKPVSAEIVEA
jgi:hypothetical protein